jgi:hypothetical protein
MQFCWKEVKVCEGTTVFYFLQLPAIYGMIPPPYIFDLHTKSLMPSGAILGKARVFLQKKPLEDWIMATGVGLLGDELRDNEAERAERNDGWRREPFI